MLTLHRNRWIHQKKGKKTGRSQFKICANCKKTHFVTLIQPSVSGKGFSFITLSLSGLTCKTQFCKKKKKATFPPFCLFSDLRRVSLKSTPPVCIKGFVKNAPSPNPRAHDTCMTQLAKSPQSEIKLSPISVAGSAVVTEMYDWFFTLCSDLANSGAYFRSHSGHSD